MFFTARSTKKKDNTLSEFTSPMNRRRFLTSIGTAATTTALAAGAYGLTPSIASAAGLREGSSYTLPAGKSSGVNVLLVHGAFADASSWSKVIPILQGAGHSVLAVQLPLTSLDDDVATTRAALSLLSGPTVLVGHSYGGAVISGAGTNAPNVISLVYAAAYAPAEGETLIDLNNRFPATPAAKHIVPAYPKGFAWIDPSAFPQVFVADIDPKQARILAVVQKPISGLCFVGKAGSPAWKKLPSWYLVSEDDQTINPDLERWMAKRMGATTSTLDSSHASPVSHPYQVAETILAAAKH